MTLGIFHLDTVPHKPLMEDQVGRLLRRAVRMTTDTDHGRMLTLEETANALVSYMRVMESKFLVRIANVDANGRPFAPEGFAKTLTTNVEHFLGRCCSYESSGTRYENVYNAGLFEDSEMLWVPNNKFVTTYVAFVLHKSRRLQSIASPD